MDDALELLKRFHERGRGKRIAMRKRPLEVKPQRPIVVWACGLGGHSRQVRFRAPAVRSV